MHSGKFEEFMSGEGGDGDLSKRDLSIQQARQDEQLKALVRTVGTILDEVRSLSQAITGPGGHGERLRSVELKLEALDADVRRMQAADDRRERETQEEWALRVKEARNLKWQVFIGLILAVASAAAAGWFSVAG